MYERAFGQTINLQKLMIFCSKNVWTTNHNNNNASILDVQAPIGIDKYLRLPSMTGRSKKNHSSTLSKKEFERR